VPARRKLGADRFSRLQVLLEIRHARLRLELVAVEFDYAIDLLSRGRINPEGALTILDDALAELWGEE
jgi:hypothetical protein